jgi:hypothetical protein
MQCISCRCRLRDHRVMSLHTLTSCSPPTRVSALRVVFNPAHWCLRVTDSASQHAAVTRSLPPESTYTEQNPRSLLSWKCKKAQQQHTERARRSVCMPYAKPDSRLVTSFTDDTGGKESSLTIACFGWLVFAAPVRVGVNIAKWRRNSW